MSAAITQALRENKAARWGALAKSLISLFARYYQNHCIFGSVEQKYKLF
ncbi:MAG: hypothetical protein RBR87_00720 [Bacteroidales bacterium]|jgi:hypothetical protein|nr:hypothetical protein [Bacteroidales bacterium]